MEKKELIFGAIGYTKLYNSSLFHKCEILLISDSHDEQMKQCNINKQDDINIDKYLELLLKNNYTIMIEEVPFRPDKKTLVGLWNESDHVKNTRIFYERNISNPKLIPFDIRFELIDSLDENDYNTQTLKKYIYNIYKFLKLEHPFFKDLILYSKLIDNSVIRIYYITILIKFYDLVLSNKSELDKEIKYILNINNKIIDNIFDLLSEILEFYVILQLYNIMQTNKKIVIYGGLAHTENIKIILNKYYKFAIKEEYGKTDFKNDYKNDFKNDYLCIRRPHF